MEQPGAPLGDDMACWQEAEAQLLREKIAAAERATDYQFVLDVDIPEDVTDDQVVIAAKELALLVDEVHRTKGGHGLRIADLQIYEDASVWEGVQ